MTALVLQARIDSSRLPRKSLLPLGGRPLVLRVMEALNYLPADVKILACPEDSVTSFASLAEEAGFSLITGPKGDVLARFCLVIRNFDADMIIRATADNPFVFIDAATALSREAANLGADYSCYSGIPHGSGVEIITSQALLRAEREARDPLEREHVCPYIYRHPDHFKLHRPLAPPCWQGQELTVTVDTAEDYERAQIVFERLSALPAEERFKGENIIAVVK